MQQIQKILVIKLKHIGDVLLASSVIAALHRHYPKAEITALVPRGTVEMLEGNPHVHDIVIFDRAIKRFSFSSLVQEEWKLLQTLRKRKFDVAIDLSGGDRGAFLARLSGAPTRIGYSRRKGMIGRDRLFTQVIAQDFKKSVVASEMDLLKPLGVHEEPPSPRLYVGAEAQANAEALLRQMGVGPQEQLIVFHPTSRWMFKSWEASHCARLSDLLVRKWECRVVFTCGPEERELKKIRQIRSLVKESVLDLAGKTTLPVLGAILERAHAFVGVDSAPLHMAYAVGIPTLSLFGPSDPVQWAPAGPMHRVITKRWACQPCQRDGCLGSKVSQCLTDLSVEEVAAVLDEWLPRALQAKGQEKALR